MVSFPLKEGNILHWKGQNLLQDIRKTWKLSCGRVSLPFPWHLPWICSAIQVILDKNSFRTADLDALFLKRIWKAQEITATCDVQTCFKVWSVCVYSGRGYKKDSGLLVLLVLWVKESQKIKNGIVWRQYLPSYCMSCIADTADAQNQMEWSKCRTAQGWNCQMFSSINQTVTTTPPICSQRLQHTVCFVTMPGS